jgi:hypothetical protein
MSDELQPLGALGVPDELVHRILARAAALDVEYASRVPLARLREIARDAGVSESALAAALTEFESALVSAPPPSAHVWRGIAAPRGWRARVVVNAVAVLGGATVMAALGRIFVALNLSDGFRTAIMLIALVLIAEAAKRAGATTVRLVTLGLLVAQGAESLLELSFGWQIQGGEAHFGLILAGLAGVTLGAVVARRGRGDPTHVPPSAAAADVADAGVPRPVERRTWWLRLQPASARGAF